MAYPDFVKKFKPKGTVVKCVDGAYYAYYATSKRVPDKSYPVQVIKGYAGTIDEFGFHPADKVTVKLGEVEIRECGFTNFMLKFEELFQLQNTRWSKAQSKTIYRSLIVYLSNNSYLNDVEKILLTTEELCSRFKISISKEIIAIQKIMEFTFPEIEPLKQICSVNIGGQMLESKLTAAQKRILERMGLEEKDVRR